MSIVCPPDTSSATKGGLRVGLLKERRVEVGLQVVDAHERHAPGHGQRLGAGDPDQQGADQPGSDGAADGVDAALRHTRLHHGRRHHRVQELKMGPAGDQRLRRTAACRSTWLDTTDETTSRPP